MTDETSLDRARAVKQKAHKLFSAIADVAGVGITTIDSKYGLKINLSSKPAADVDLPKDVDGVPVRVEVVGSIRKQPVPKKKPV